MLCGTLHGTGIIIHLIGIPGDHFSGINTGDTILIGTPGIMVIIVAGPIIAIITGTIFISTAAGQGLLFFIIEDKQVFTKKLIQDLKPVEMEMHCLKS